MGSAAAKRPEELDVLEWRAEQFEQLGFEAAVANALAGSSADLGVARKLIATGCSVELARSILL